VTYGSDLTKVDSTDLQIYGQNLIPWTVTGFEHELVVSDWVFNWIERPRFDNALKDYQEIPHDPDFGGYAVAIYDGSNIVRTAIVYDTTWTYTEAQMINDFGSVQLNLKLSVQQLSNRFGGGRPIVVNI
jgi:hypothetical protein